MSIRVEHVSRRFGSYVALDDVSLDIRHGELVALLGPSGSGKTTLLRVIAGLEAQDRGRVLFDGQDTSSTDVRQRQVGFVFQHYALFEHMSVFENVAFGLRVRPRRLRLPAAEIKKQVDALISMVQLGKLSERYPNQLSGGQRQRVALARALAVQPRVLLLDEPFGALDAKVRKDLRHWLRRLHDEVGITSVFVTHDQEEAMEIADRIVVMNHARIVQVGTPEEVQKAPATPFVYEFLGDVNLFHGRKYARPHEVEVLREAQGNNAIAATVEHVVTRGSVVRVALVTGASDTIEADLTHEQSRDLGLAKGEAVFVRPTRVQVFDDGQAAAE